MIVQNLISCSVAAPCTHGDVIEQIAEKSAERIPIESLSSDLRNIVFPRGRVIFGFPGDYFDQIARNYRDMWWWVSERGLKMAMIAVVDVSLSRFDELAGKLMHEAESQRLSNGRLPLAAYASIAALLDQSGFRPAKHLEGKVRKELADWNQKHPRGAIHTFNRALKLPWLRTAVKRRLYRAASKFKKAHPELSGI